MTKKFIEKIMSRVFVTLILLVLQLVWIIVVYWNLWNYAGWVNLMFGFVSFVLSISIVRKDWSPAYTIGWILLMGFIPLLGAAMYLLFGNKQPSKYLRNKLYVQNEKHVDDLRQEPQVIEEINAKLKMRVRSTSRYIRNYGGYPAWENTAIKYYRVGEDLYSEVLEDLAKAEKFIFFEFYMVSDGKLWKRIYEVLKQKAKQGVDVRFIYDDIGSIHALPDNFIADLRENNIKCFAFNPLNVVASMVLNHRDHRKIIIIDGKIAFNGGSNLADEYVNEIVRFGHWKDTSIRLEGAAVWNFTVMFLNMWNAFYHTENDYAAFRPDEEFVKSIKSDGVLQPFSDSPLDEEPIAENVYLDIINQSKKYLYIFTPYLIIGHGMMSDLCLAAKRGVDVRIVVPNIPDKKAVFRLTRSYYPPLLNAGVKIYQYTPGFIHAKSCVCDDVTAVVGTINMDYRSLHLHFECGTLMMNNSEILKVKEDALDIFEKSKRITIDDCHTTVWGNLFDDILRAASPLM